MPFPVTANPIKLPHFARADITDPGDRTIDRLLRTAPLRADKKEIDGLVGEALPFADFVAQLERRPAFRPEILFDGLRVFSNLGFGESHIFAG